MKHPFRLFAALVAIAAVAYVIYRTTRHEPATTSTSAPAAGARVLGSAPASAPASPDTAPAGAPDTTPATQAWPAPVPAPATQASPADRAKAASGVQQAGAQLAAGKLVAARGLLADALNLGALPADQVPAVRRRLIDLVGRTIFSRTVHDGDPCTFSYKIKPGDVLVRVERAQRLRVPTQLIANHIVNPNLDPARLQIGQTIKLIRGPFHAVVSKSRFTMDVYLEEFGSRPPRLILARTYKVGTGKDGSTPLGRWHVVHGGKTDKSTWTPTSGSNLPRKGIRWGQPGYPLGKKGYWIGLEGIAGNPHTKADAYGIHGTNDPASIGKASSMGCIRLGDSDIEEVFSLLYEHWSTVTIRP